MRFHEFFTESFVMDVFKKFPGGTQLFKVDKRSSKTMCYVCSKLTIKTPDGVSFVEFEQVNAAGVFLNFEKNDVIIIIDSLI